MKYIVIQPFASIEVGSHSDGEEIELTAEQAKQLAPFIQPLGKANADPVIETADLQPDAETADVKAPKRKK